jgi:glycosyltransferase involved in cell wall biosynthesis
MGKVRRITVVTPSFNQGRFIERTIQSVVNQKLDAELEYIIVDGGSTDETLGILEKYKHRLFYISEPDQGMADALNKGFARATGDVLAWLNSDDIYLPGTLQNITDHFTLYPEHQWVYGHCRMIDEEDREVRRWITKYKLLKSKSFSYSRLLVENFISQPAVFFKRDLLAEAGPVDTDLPTAMDYDLWLRMGRLSEPGVVQCFLAAFRVHKLSISARQYRRQFQEQYEIHQRYDNTAWLLYRHRMMIRLIIAVYSGLELLRKASVQRIFA